MNLKKWFKTKTLLAMALAGLMFAALLPMQSGEKKTAYAAGNAIEDALYNYDYYVKANDDVAQALNKDPNAMYQHWINCGKAEGRNASMVFNAKYYLEVNPEVAAMVGNDYVAAYNHFVTTGIYQGLESSPVFDVKYYLKHNTDVASYFNNDYVMAAVHFNQSAIAEGRSGSGNFDYTVYSYCNTDVAALYGKDVMGYYVHYINHGRAEGRTGGFGTLSTGGIDKSTASYRIFDVNFYLDRYPLLKITVGTDPDTLYKYWLETGIALGQTASPVIVPEEYRAMNTDVAEAFGEDDEACIRHFINSGIFEGRTGSYEFDYTIYEYCNTDVAMEFGKDIVGYYWHYVHHGKAENRTAAAFVHIHEFDENYVCQTCDFEYFTEGLAYTLSSDGTYYIVTGMGEATGKKLIIPREYKGLKVREIASSAFSAENNVTELLIPTTIKKIGYNAFSGCTKLEKVQFNALECAALSSSGTFAGAGQSETGMTVIVGSGVTRIPENLFYNNTNVIKVTFNGSKVTEIGAYAFYNGKKLMEITIPEGVETIGSSAFQNCGLIKSVVIPSTVETLGSRAFYSCASLEEIQFNAEECVSNGTKDYSPFYSTGENGDGITVTIGSEVTSIPAYLFYSNAKITNVVFQGIQVKNIGESAFYNCDELSEMVIPEGVETIGKDVFKSCEGLESLVIPSTVKSIGIDAFASCTELEKVQYNAIECAQVYYVEGHREMYNSAYIYYDTYYYGAFASAGTKGDGFTVTVGSEVTHIPAYLFYNSSGDVVNVTEVIFQGSKMEEIGIQAFYNCDKLSEIVIPGEVVVGEKAFYDCNNLTEVTFSGSGSVEIGDSAFCICDNLTEVTFSGSGSVIIGDYAFHDCDNLTEVTFSGSGSVIIGDYAFSHCDNRTEVVLPEGTKSIGDSAFCGCDSLKSIVIPSTVESIGGYAFGYCTNLEEIQYNAVNCANIERWYENDGKHYWVSPPFCCAGQGGDGVTVIIGSEVTRIPMHLFSTAYTNWGDVGTYGIYLDRYANVAKVVFEGTKVTEIGAYAFYYCKNLSEITLPESVTTIGTNAFYGTGVN